MFHALFMFGCAQLHILYILFYKYIYIYIDRYISKQQGTVEKVVGKNNFLCDSEAELVKDMHQ